MNGRNLGTLQTQPAASVSPVGTWWVQRYLKPKPPRDLIEADVDKRTRYDAQRKKQRIEIYRKHIAKQARDDSDFWGRYSKYLNSPEWFTKRAKVLERAGGPCEGCREREATQVHHLSYRHAMDELLFELVAVCDICHDKCHPEPAKVYQAGEGFYEMPGAHHKISENASGKDPASLLAVYVVDSKDRPLTTADQK